MQIIDQSREQKICVVVEGVCNHFDNEWQTMVTTTFNTEDSDVTSREETGQYCNRCNAWQDPSTGEWVE